MTTAQKLLRDVLALPRDERQRLSEALTNSLSVTDSAKVRPSIAGHLEASIEANRDLCRRLAR